MFIHVYSNFSLNIEKKLEIHAHACLQYCDEFYNSMTIIF